MSGPPGLDGAQLREALSERYFTVALVAPYNNFRPARVAGDLCFVSSMTPASSDGSELQGRLGRDRSLADGQQAARRAVANSVAWLAAEIDAVERRAIDAVDVLVFCNTDGDYNDQSIVADAASELLNDIFQGTAGHARGAIGAASLVRNSLVVVKVTYLLS